MLLNLRGGQKGDKGAIRVNAADEIKPIVWARPAVLPFSVCEKKSVPSRHILNLNATRRFVGIKGFYVEAKSGTVCHPFDPPGKIASAFLVQTFLFQCSIPWFIPARSCLSTHTGGRARTIC